MKKAQVELILSTKDLKKIPNSIIKRLQAAIEHIELFGMEEFRRNRGRRDEALRGKRLGQRSFRLNRQWRVVYKEVYFEDEPIILISIIEVIPHSY